MAVPVFSPFDADELREMYAHAAALVELVEGTEISGTLQMSLANLMMSLEYHFAETDPLVDKQPAIQMVEVLEVVPA